MTWLTTHLEHLHVKIQLSNKIRDFGGDRPSLCKPTDVSFLGLFVNELLDCLEQTGDEVGSMLPPRIDQE